MPAITNDGNRLSTLIDFISKILIPMPMINTPPTAAIMVMCSGLINDPSSAANMVSPA